MSSNIKFEDAMKARIEKMQRPVINNAEDLQKTQIGGTFTILSEFAKSIENAYSRILKDEFRQKLSETKLLDENEIMECFDVLNDKKHEHHAEAIEKWKEFVIPPMSEAHRMVEAGMNATAINYAGLVLEGKMEPIYDASLDDDGREETIETVNRTLESITTDLGMAGSLEETKDGKLKLRPHMRTFTTVDEKEKDNG